MIRHFKLSPGYLVIAALAQAGLAQVAFAQTSSSTSNSTSGSNATTTAGSAATSMAGTSTAVINQFQNSPSHTDATVRSAPAIGGIGLFGGTNPCTEGAAGAVSVVGVGVGFGGQWSARACERRNAAVILFQANMPDVAVAVLCQDDEISAAFRAAGRPCPQETRVASRTPAPMAAAGVPAAPQGPAMAGPGVPAPAQTAPANAGAPIASATDVGRPVLFSTSDDSAEPMRYRGPPPSWCREAPTSPDASAAHAYYCQ